MGDRRARQIEGGEIQLGDTVLVLENELVGPPNTAGDFDQVWAWAICVSARARSSPLGLPRPVARSYPGTAE